MHNTLFTKKGGLMVIAPIVFDNVYKFIAKDGMYKCIKTIKNYTRVTKYL